MCLIRLKSAWTLSVSFKIACSYTYEIFSDISSLWIKTGLGYFSFISVFYAVGYVTKSRLYWAVFFYFQNLVLQPSQFPEYYEIYNFYCIHSEDSSHSACVIPTDSLNCHTLIKVVYKDLYKLKSLKPFEIFLILFIKVHHTSGQTLSFLQLLVVRFHESLLSSWGFWKVLLASSRILIPKPKYNGWPNKIKLKKCH